MNYVKLNRINSITLHDGSGDHAPLIKRDRDTAIKDLQAGSVFAPTGDENGPYDLDISIQESRLVVQITCTKGEVMPMLVLSIKPYKRLIKDYFMIMRSYEDALRDGKPSRIEAIDMGRRGLHNEGAQLLIDRLEDKVEMDFDTARRLFTLICALHESKAMVWR